MLLTKDLDGPNGLALSPDEKYLYVDNWNLKKEVIMRYEVQSNGTIAMARSSSMRPERPARTPGTA